MYVGPKNLVLYGVEIPRGKRQFGLSGPLMFAAKGIIHSSITA